MESVNLKETRQIFSEQDSYGHDSPNKKVPNFWKKTREIKNKNLRQTLGRDRLRKNKGGNLVRSGEIPSSRQTSIDKTNNCVMNSERGALVRGSDPP